jgi:hypothetical protein
MRHTWSWLILGAALGCSSPHVHTATVRAGDAVDFTVTAAESKTLAGTRLEVPEGAVADGTVLTLDQGTSSLVPQADNAGPVAVFGPSGLRFHSPGRVTMPFALPAGRVLAQLGVQVQERDGTTHWLSPRVVTVDAAAGVVRFDVDGFSSFQPSTQVCVADTDCGGGEACAAGVCATPATKPCLAEADCASAEACVSGVCTSTCVPASSVCVPLASAHCPPTAQEARAAFDPTTCDRVHSNSGSCGDFFATVSASTFDLGAECLYRHGGLVGFSYLSDTGLTEAAGLWVPECSILWFDDCHPDAGTPSCPRRQAEAQAQWCGRSFVAQACDDTWVVSGPADDGTAQTCVYRAGTLVGEDWTSSGTHRVEGDVTPPCTLVSVPVCAEVPDAG